MKVKRSTVMSFNQMYGFTLATYIFILFQTAEHLRYDGVGMVFPNFSFDFSWSHVDWVL